MVKNKKKTESPISAIANNFGKGVLDGVNKYVTSIIKEKVQKIEKEITKTALSILMVIFGVFLLFISLIFFLRIYLGLNYAQVFFSVGMVSLIIGIIVKYLKWE